ncbi:unnamed protein product [Gordionus sp. m RMFG-2023]
MSNFSTANIVVLNGRNLIKLCPIKNDTSNHALIWNASAIINIATMPILLFLGIVGNGIGLYVTKRIRKRHRKTAGDLYYYYLTYIAWINLIISLFGAFRMGENMRKFFTYSVYSPNYAWLYFYARCTISIMNGFFSASILILCLLLRDRYMNLHKPFRQRAIANSNMNDRIVSNLGHLVGIDTRHWRSRFLKLMPMIFIIISNVLSFSNYFWYDVIECSISESPMKFNPLNYYRNFRGTANSVNYRNNNDTNFYVKGVILHWSVTYDLIRVITVLVLPGFAILYYGFGITYYVFKFMEKHRKTSSTDRTQISTVVPLRCSNKIGITHSLGLIDLRPNSLTLTTGYNMGHGKAPMGNDKTSNQSSFDITYSPLERMSTHTKFAQNSKQVSTKKSAKILARNLSALIYFALFCLCEIPNIVLTILRYTIRSELVMDISDMMELIFVTLIFYLFMLFDNNFQEEFSKLRKRFWLIEYI